MNKSDILSAFLEQPDIFSDEFIVDETMDLFLAGSQSTQFATQSVVCHFATAPDSLAQARNEFEYYMEDQLYKHAELKKK